MPAEAQKTFYLEIFGCQMNVYDGARMAAKGWIAEGTAFCATAVADKPLRSFAITADAEKRELDELLRLLVEMGGSDLHITTNSPPQIRVDGHLRRHGRAGLASRRAGGVRHRRAF